MNFGLKGVKGTASNYLKAWGIYDVALRKIEYVNGTSKTGNPWEGMQVTFSGDAGTYTKLFFCPGEKGEERVSGESDGRKWTLPSNYEVLGAVLAHLGENLSPDKYKKFQEVEFELPKDFKKLVELFKETMAPAINKMTKLKLVGDKKNYANIPSFVSIDSKGGATIVNNWVGPNVTFSPKELERKEKAAHTPTKMENSGDIDKSNDDINLDELNRSI